MDAIISSALRQIKTLIRPYPSWGSETPFNETAGNQKYENPARALKALSESALIMQRWGVVERRSPPLKRTSFFQESKHLGVLGLGTSL